MYELWQTEWCLASRRVRQQLTELGIDYITRQVPVEKDDRALLRARTGTKTHKPVPAEARAHRLKAESARRRYLEEECECPPQPATR